MGEQHPEKARLPTPLVALLLCGFSVLQAMAAAASKEGGEYPLQGRRVLNNLNFVTLYYVDAPTFQILGNLKIVATGLAGRYLLKRKLDTGRWLALVLLTLGAASSQVAPDCAGDGAAFLRLGDRAYGYASAVACVGLSATMGVFTEAFMKGTRSSIHFQNMQLYAFGIAANLAALLYRGEVGAGASPLFAGFNVWGSVATVANGCCGLAVSFMLRYADSIAKTYASALTIPATAAASYACPARPSAPRPLGSGVMLASLAFFYGGADLFAPPDAGKLPGAAGR
ncbi:pyrimidine nucleotide-sugar transmembrane transporter [Aureococcus anophagefferens]|nr:pyrimidine nucleotide-sugar transmembrane transporter [Aureococcus anophagefferens]